MIVPHPNPDGDAFGSASAMHQYLKNIGVKAVIFCPTPIQPKLFCFSSVPAEAIIIAPEVFTDHKVDTIIVLDSGDLRYAGIAEYVKGHQATIINIDHHATNEHYGTINFVNIKAAATAELIYEFFTHNRVQITPIMATGMMAGLITDTDNFSNSATTPSSLAIAGELVRLGANYRLIHNHTQKDKTFNLLKLWGAALSRLVKNEDLDLAYTYLTHEDFIRYEISENDSDGLANFMNNLEGAKISLILKETTEGKIKGSFRTSSNEIDVSIMAKKLGGGGHKKAAGFTVDGTIEQILARVLTIDK